jgi:DNA primase
MKKKLIVEEFRKNPVLTIKMLGGQKITLKGGYLSCRCPLPDHPDKNPSFSISTETGCWHCFSKCGGGDLFGLFGKIRGIDPQYQFPLLLEEFSHLLFSTQT